jgi:hypothetical protein
MKFSLLALAAVVGTAAAGKPQLSVSLVDCTPISSLSYNFSICISPYFLLKSS